MTVIITKKNQESSTVISNKPDIPSTKLSQTSLLHVIGAKFHSALYTAPEWVDESKPPGHTSEQDIVLTPLQVLRSILTLDFFFGSIMFPFFTLCCVVYYVFPYEIEKFKVVDGAYVNSNGRSAFIFPIEQFLSRLQFNLLYIGAWYAFFAITLYCPTDLFKSLGVRKYTGRWPTAANFAHNIFYWALGVLQCTVWECVMCVIWANCSSEDGWKYVTNAELLSSPSLLLWNFVAGVSTVILYREIHFYVIHRFTHIRFIYKYVHSVHHRNTDLEPFSGICMHPIEHLLYFSAAFVPSLIISDLSPLVFAWNYFHLTILPAMAHSGFEDHFQNNQYHALHHAKMECNYGDNFTKFIDLYMGTYREKFGESETYSGEAKNCSEGELSALHGASGNDGSKVVSTKAIAEANNLNPSDEKKEKVSTKDTDKFTDPSSSGKWSEHSYLAFQKGSHLAYSVAILLITIALLFQKRIFGVNNDIAYNLVPALVAVAPFATAFVLTVLSKDPVSWRWPFQKDGVSFVVFAMAGVFMGVLPVYMAVKEFQGVFLV